MSKRIVTTATVVLALLASSYGLCAETTLDTWRRLGRQGVSAREEGRLADAERLLSQAIQSAYDSGFDTPLIDPFLLELMAVYDAQGRIDELRSTHPVCSGPQGVRDSQYWQLALCGLLHDARGDYANALIMFRRLRERTETLKVRPDHPGLRSIFVYLSFLCFATGDVRSATDYLDRSRVGRELPVVPDALEDALYFAALGYREQAAGRKTRAYKALQKASKALEHIPWAQANRATVAEAIATVSTR